MTSTPGRTERKRIGDYFTRAATTFDTFYDKKRSRFMQAVDQRFRSDIFERYRLTFEAMDPLEGKTVLDIGCGSGPYLAEALKRGASHVVGVDLSEEMIRLARERLAPVLASPGTGSSELLVAAFPEEAPEGVFDHAIAMGVMDYVADPAPFLAALPSRLRHSAILSFPSIHWFRTPFRKVRYTIKRCPVYFYEHDEVDRLLRTAGFDDVTIIPIPGAGMDYVAIGHVHR